MIWNQLSVKTRDTMEELGSFGPTADAAAREVKGYTLDGGGEAGKTYYTSNDLREIAAACVEVADWLDRRAEEHAT